jgi:hypothetical protein
MRLLFLLSVLPLLAAALPAARDAGSASCEGSTFLYGGSLAPDTLTLITPALETRIFSLAEADGLVPVRNPAVACLRMNDTLWTVVVHGGLRGDDDLFPTNDTLEFRFDTEADGDGADWRVVPAENGLVSSGAFAWLTEDGTLRVIGGDCDNDVAPEEMGLRYTISSLDLADPDTWTHDALHLDGMGFPLCNARYVLVDDVLWVVAGLPREGDTRPMLSRVDPESRIAEVLLDDSTVKVPWTRMPYVVPRRVEDNVYLFIAGGDADFLSVVSLATESLLPWDNKIPSDAIAGRGFAFHSELLGGMVVQGGDRDVNPVVVFPDVMFVRDGVGNLVDGADTETETEADEGGTAELQDDDIDMAPFLG